ncbi:GMC family oxidoreductase [Noviherbaspirillum sp. 17J57-3]|uniref:GMC family oxidoreductase n=2 Tax=Noviherbaspirillum galbum TaxID=2709383 RepID=A0A6B3SML0_9BURK|nr:GMC family oxidoreductase [Noviherbaspirillum galbum]
MEAIVVGTGPGGAMVARELARRGRRVLLLEQGGAAPFKGSLLQMAGMAAIPGKGAFFNLDGSLLVRGLTAGGSSAINFATALSPPLPMFDRLGIDLRPALEDVKRQVPLAPLPDALVGPAARRIMQAALGMDLPWRKLDKTIYADKCQAGCWRCVYGCPTGAKWTARNLAEEAAQAGARVLTGARAERVIVEDGRACGVAFMQAGRRRVARAGTVILAGGGIGSPRLLRRSGLPAGNGTHFSDPVIAVMGSVDDMHDGGAEVPMAAGLHLAQDGVMLSDMSLPLAMYRAFALQVGRLDLLSHSAHARTLTIMVKIRDRIGGRIGPHWVNKRLHADDKEKFRKGVALAEAILRQAGARRIFRTWHFAAHPGGSAPIGEVVDTDLRTATPGLYLCDASVIPGEWGLPPTLTLLCLATRLAAHIADERLPETRRIAIASMR